MLFLFETKKKGIISVEADIVNGELRMFSPSSAELGKTESKDLESVARTLLGTEGKFEDSKKDVRNYK